MTVDNTYQPKVHIKQGGDTQVIKDGGSLELGDSVSIAVSGTNIILTGLPTSDPGIAGALYVNNKFLKLSDS
jgi:hypothetical protein